MILDGRYAEGSVYNGNIAILLVLAWLPCSVAHHIHIFSKIYSVPLFDSRMKFLHFPCFV